MAANRVPEGKRINLAESAGVRCQNQAVAVEALSPPAIPLGPWTWGGGPCRRSGRACVEARHATPAARPRCGYGEEPWQAVGTDRDGSLALGPR